MSLLIDGYNLLHVTGIVGRAGSGLQGSRNALLRFLANTLADNERAATTIVFDAADAPPGLPRTVQHEGMTVHFASNYDDADALIEELISKNHVPRSLTVVSSDHRLQRAARRRRAAFVDSDQWFAEAVRRRSRARKNPVRTAKPVGNLTADEVAHWLAEFAADQKADNQGPGSPRDAGDIYDPFPPGYGEDLLE